MSHHWWLPCLTLFYVTLLGFGTYNSLSKASRNRQTHLLGPLRWQIVGHILVALAYGVTLIGDFAVHLPEVAVVVVFVMLLVAGMSAFIYGKRQERAFQAVTALPNDFG